MRIKAGINDVHIHCEETAMLKAATSFATGFYLADALP